MPGVSGAGGPEGEVGDTVNSALFFDYLFVRCTSVSTTRLAVFFKLYSKKDLSKGEFCK